MREVRQSYVVFFLIFSVAILSVSIPSANADGILGADLAIFSVARQHRYRP
jgi:hypothetical protein